MLLLFLPSIIALNIISSFHVSFIKAHITDYQVSYKETKKQAKILSKEAKINEKIAVKKQKSLLRKHNHQNKNVSFITAKEFILQSPTFMQGALSEIEKSTDSESAALSLQSTKSGPVVPSASDFVCKYSGAKNAVECSWNKLPFSDTTSINYVQPGGDSRCMTASTPFTFTVEKGLKNNILFYFQAGGVCADQSNYDNWQCNTHPTLGTREGVLNRKSNNNKFKDFTTIEVLYCSGDFHLGYNDAPMVDSDGVPAKYRGQANVMSVVNWIKTLQEIGDFPTEFDNFVIMGASAGAGGAQFWSNFLIKTFNSKYFSVVMDSLFTYLPKRSDGTSYEMILLNDLYAVCKSPIISLPNPLADKCKSGSLSSMDIIAYSIKNNPTVPFFGIQSKLDYFQIIMHNMLAKQFNIQGPGGEYNVLALDQYFNDLYNNIFIPLRKNKNFILFIVDGITHTYVNWPFAFTSTDRGCGGDIIQKAQFIIQFCDPNILIIDGSFKLSSSLDAIASPQSQTSSPLYSACYDGLITLLPKCNILTQSNGWNVNNRSPYSGVQNFDSCEVDDNCEGKICNYGKCIPGPKNCILSSQCAKSLNCILFNCAV